MDSLAKEKEESATVATKAALAETPGARNTARTCPNAPTTATAGLGSANNENNISNGKDCLSPPRPRQQRAACKPSPARSAAAVILATLLGGQQQQQQQQPSDASRKEGEDTPSGKEGTGGTSGAKGNVAASSQNASAATEDGDCSAVASPSPQSWGPRVNNEAGRRACLLGDWRREIRDDPHWGLSEPPPGEERSASPAGAATRGEVLEGGTSGRRGGGEVGAPALGSDGFVRRSPRQRSPRMREIKSGSHREGKGQESKRGSVKVEEGLAGRCTPPLDAVGRSCEDGVKSGGEDRKIKREGSGRVAGGGDGMLCSPERLGSGCGSSDDFGGYSRKEKSLGLLCGRFVEVYGRSQHFRDKVSGEEGRVDTSGDGPEGMVELDRAAGELGVARRRIYDVINILESVCVVTRARKNTYRWHGKSNLVLTLRQLQRTAALVFPDEVVRNGMTKCLQRAKLPGFDNAVGSLGGPRADGNKEKSLGGLCRRFVQLFLVGNDVVSVAEAAEKLSEPDDVADGNVVYKTRARRLYDIANALGALGLVEKVRSRDSYKPNFRWIGIPVRKLPLLDAAQAKQAGLDIAARDSLLHANSFSGSIGSGGGTAAGGVGQEPRDAPGPTTSAGTADAAAVVAGAGGGGGSKSRAKGVDAMKAGDDGGRRRARKGKIDVPDDDGEARSPVAAGAPGSGPQPGRRGARRDAQRSLEGRSNSNSPCVQRAGRFVSAVVTPSTAGSSASGMKAWTTSSSECMSDQESPVDPRKVMREFPEPELCGASGDGSSSNSSGSTSSSGRKRSRTANRCDSWLTGEAAPRTIEPRLQRRRSRSLSPVSSPLAPSLSPPRSTAAAVLAASATVAAKTRDAIAAARGTPTAPPPRLKRGAVAVSAGEEFAPPVLGRKRRASCDLVPSPEARGRAACVSESPLRPDATADQMRVWNREQRTPASDSRSRRHRGAVSARRGGGEDRVGGEGGEDWSCSSHEVVDGAVVGDAVAVTPRGRGLPPPDPDAMRARLDAYMKVYTEQWKLWRKGGTPNFPPPPLGQPMSPPPPYVEPPLPAASVSATGAESKSSPAAVTASGPVGRRTRQSLGSNNVKPSGVCAKKKPSVLFDDGTLAGGDGTVVRDEEG